MRTYDTSEFSSPSFTASRSGSTLTGGADAQFTTVYDSGTVKVTVNGFTATASFGQGSTAQSIALALRDTINASPGTYLVQAVASEVSTSPPEWSIDLTALTAGNLTYSLSAQANTDFPSEFSSPPSFAVVSDSSVTGGQDAVYEQFNDSGTFSVTVGVFTVNVPYSQTSNSTASEIAAVLRAGFNGASSPVISGGTGAQVDFSAKQAGLGGNYAVTVSAVSNDPANFTPPSFTGTSANLSGGVDEQLTMATPAVTTYTYDVLDNLKQVAQGAQTRTYAYDSLSRLTSVKTPETNNLATSFTYNNFSQVLTRTDPRGVVKSFTYDGLNRLTQVAYSDGTPAVSFAYGTNPASNNKGRLTTVTYNGSSNTESFTYDMLGRVTQATKKIDNVNYPVSYAYNLASELSSITYPSGRVVQQSYDGIGRLSTIASGGTTYASGFAYNTAQQVTGFTYGNQVAASFGYSAQRLQLTSLSYRKDLESLLDLSYSYAANGQISKITDLVDNGRTVDYSYDPLGRLQTAVTVGSSTYAQWGLAWSYDRYGNRAAQNVTAGSAPAPQLTISQTTNRITSAGYSYDASGNMTNDAVNAYTYDAENRIKTVNGTGATYSYDGAGLRVKKVAGGVTTRYIYSGTKVIAEYVNGTLSKEYIYSGSGLLATLDSGGTPTYHHTDHLSVRVNTNSSGTTVGQQGHYPFGESWYSTSTTSKWQFTTYERDSESGLDYAMFRYDSSRLGRFMTPDPISGSIGNPQSLNRYAYTRNDPINLVDPLGLLIRCGVNLSFLGTFFPLDRPSVDLFTASVFCFNSVDISGFIDEIAARVDARRDPKKKKKEKTEAQKQVDCANDVVTELFNEEVIPNLRIQAALTSVQSTVDPNSNKIKFDFTLDNTVPAKEFPTDRPGTAPALEIYKKSISINGVTKTTSGRGDVDPNNPRFRPFSHLKDILVEHLGGKLPAPCDLLRRLRNQ